MASDGPKSGAGKVGGGPAGIGSFKQNTAADVKPAGIGGGNSNDAKNANAANGLSKAEDNATGAVGDTSASDSAVDDAVAAEEDVSHTYTGGGDGGEVQTVSLTDIFDNHKKTVLLIIVLFIMFAVASLGSALNPLVAFKENVISRFGQSSAVMNKRSNFMMRRILQKKSNTGTDSVFDGKKFNISVDMQKNFEKQKIYYTETTDSDGNNVRMLLYEDDAGRITPVVGSDADVELANKFVGSDIDIEIDGVKRSVKITESSVTLSTAKANKNFSAKYDTVTASTTSKSAGWFDKMTDLMLDRIVGPNARKQTNIEDTSKEKTDDMMMKNSSKGSDDTEISSNKVKDADGNLVDAGVDADGDPVRMDGTKITDENGVKIKDNPDVKAALESSDGLKIGNNERGKVAADLTSKATKAVVASAQVACGILRAIGAISVTVGAIQTVNAIAYASKVLELADKIKSGEADLTADYYLEEMSEKMETTAYDISGNEVKDYGSVLDGDGFNTFFSNKNLINENDPGALFANREAATKMSMFSLANGEVGEKAGLVANAAGSATSALAAIASFGGGVKAFRMCNNIQAAAGIVDAVGDVVTLIATWGTATAAKEIIKGVAQTAATAAVMVLIGAVVSLVTPMVASWLAGNLAQAFLGKNGSFVLASGVQSITNTNLQMSTGRFADRTNVIQMAVLTKDVETEWAEYERATRSPFDLTSKYTFLGSIANSFIPIINSSGNKLISPLSSTISLAGSSALAMLNPTAFAADEVEALSIASEGNCEYLDSAGVAGDFACNKYAGAYVEELETMDPEENYQAMVASNEFAGEDQYGNPQIRSGSDYAKYIVACVTSDSQPGTVNGVVQGALTKMMENENIAVSAAANIGTSIAPVVGGILDSVEAAEQEKNLPWTSGTACNDESMKSYSMYNLDQRVLNDLGVTQSNSTYSFLENYYKENPIDYSLEGTIARFSGLTTDQVSNVLAAIDYFNYVANYDPTTRYAFGQEVRPAGADEIRFDNDQKVAYVVLLNTIEFADVRNRSFVV